MLGLPYIAEDSKTTLFTFAHYWAARNESNAAENSVKRHDLIRPVK